MNKIEALTAAVVHWRENACATHPSQVSIGTDACALCRFYLPMDCHGCPVARATRQPDCNGSPYGRAWRLLRDWRETRHLAVKECSIDDGEVAQRLAAEFSEAAGAEADFLLDLLVGQVERDRAWGRTP